MRPTPMLLALLLSQLSVAVVPHPFVSGSPAKASDVNDNFNYLDSTVQKKASQSTVDAISSAINAKADGSLKDSVASLRAAVGAKADQSAITSLQATKVDTSALRQVRDTVRTKKDSVWIVNAIGAKTDGSWKDSVTSLRTAVGTKADPTWVTNQLATKASLQNLSDSAAAIRKTTADTNWVIGKVAAAQSGNGALLAKYNLSDLTDTATARKNLGLGALATRSSITSSDVTAALTYTPVNPTALSSYLPVSAGSGNALTGGLYGTSATFSGNLGISGTSTLQASLVANAGITCNGWLVLPQGTFRPLAASSTWEAFYGATVAAPSPLNWSWLASGDGTVAGINGATKSVLDVGGTDIVTANSIGALIAGNLSLSGTISLPYYPQGSTPGAIGNTMLIGNASDLNAGSGGYELTIALPSNASHWPFAIYKGGSQLFQVDTHGNTAIAGKLTVASSGSSIPDYVFEPTYHLPALSEVEAYTQEHKHLPEVPSASDIEKGGMDLAQMNLILLKKVEELTLHAIEQQKQVEAATKKMEVQEARLDDQQRMIDELKTAGAKP